MTTAITAPHHLQELIKKFESTSTKRGGGGEGGGSSSFPSTIDFYRFGLVLFDLVGDGNGTANAKAKAKANTDLVFDAYNAYLETLPPSYLSTVMNELTLAFQSVLSSSSNQTPSSSSPDDDDDDDANNNDTVNASRSIAGLCLASSIACQAAYSVELCVSLASSYDVMTRMQPAASSQQQQRKEEYESVSTSLLQTMHDLWNNGLLPSLATLLNNSDDDDGDDGEETAMQQAMELVEALIAADTNTFLGDALQMQLSANHQQAPSFLKSIRTTFQEDTPQREYLLKMVESSSRSSDHQHHYTSSTSTKKSATDAPTKKTAAVVDARTEIQRRIQQVKDVLPELGEGYIESVLSHFGGDVSRTVAALFDPSSLPPALKLLDTTLPARRQENAMSTTTYHLDDVEARDITKERLADMEREQEAVAYAITTMGLTENNNTADDGADEYNDDYDDQYDGMDAGENLAGTGGTYDDVDIDTVRVYNRVARQAEQEQDFWEQSRNTNRRGSPSQNIHRNNKNNKKKAPDTENQESANKTYRGPNKIKGGRAVDADGKVLPRQRGGKKGKNQTAAVATAPTTANPKNNQANQTAKQKNNQPNTAKQNKNQPKKTPGGGGGGAKQNNNQPGGEAPDLTKIQKRRKNDNKAKLGNHNRKKGAQKKAAGAM